jgi:two-component system OmpR family sensor kinase
MSSPSLKRRLVLAATGAVALMLTLITVGFNVVLDGRLSDDANSVVHSRVQAGLAVSSIEDGHVVVEETPHDNALDERIWIFEGGRSIERARAPAAVQTAVNELAGATGVTTRDVGAQRLLAHPLLSSSGQRVGSVVATVSLLPYQHSQRIALIASLVLSIVILAGLAIVARILIGRALRPVARMTAQAADWSEHDLDRRFALGTPRDEFTGLAATLDGLLGRLSASLRHEKRFSAELAHELRTPLSKLHAEAELALARERPADELRESLEAVLRYTDRMTGVVDALMAAAEREADPRTGTVDAGAAAEAAVAACADSAADRGITVKPERGQESIEVDADADITVALLVPLISNAIRYGRSLVRLSVTRDGASVAFRVSDDGPGLAPDELEAVFEPGVRGSAANGSAGAGLGLALARRLARSAGGDVVAEAATGGGRFVVRLPAS